MNFTRDLITDIAATCNVPTGNGVLDRVFDDYNTGSARHDSPIYYRFLYRLAERFRAERLTMIEVGFQRGGASLHFLKGGGELVVGVDLNDRRDLSQFDGQNFRPVIADSRSNEAVAGALWELGKRNNPDIVFIDTNHHEQMTADEYALWRPLVRPGGLMLFDDICAPEFGCTKWWNELEPLPGWVKMTLPELHPTNWGYGCLIAPAE